VNCTAVKASTIHRRGGSGKAVGFGARDRQLSLPRLPPPYTFLSRNTISSSRTTSVSSSRYISLKPDETTAYPHPHHHLYQRGPQFPPTTLRYIPVTHRLIGALYPKRQPPHRPVGLKYTALPKTSR
jgi:hypothetical protein